ncbi:MAG: hypothetical protein EHM24_21535 [Acidobacteria bacterium]|nr:MAG: hypothetical protein EHM24_21535 [Acidobacteriota bacterium]
MPVGANTDEVLRGQSRSPRFARSGQMVACLRQELLYSEKRARDILFAAIAQLIGSTPDGSLMVARLTREAATRAREEAERAGYEFANWDNAAKAVVKALLSSESLLDPAGQPIRFDVSAHASLVGSLREDYQDRAEAFLLEFLLRRLGDVTVRDHTALAHALFRQFDRSVPMDDLEDRVVILLARIADRIALNGDTYSVRAR